MPFQKKSTSFKCGHCQRQGHLVKHYTILRKRRERQAILVKPLGLEASTLLALPLEAFTTTQTETWENQVKQIEW